MEKISRKNLFFIGLTLFSMFFGAGNLIFPPYLGEQAGNQAWIAQIGFLISAVGLPILGVIAVAKSQGLVNLAGRVHPIFAKVFTLLIYLSIGPCLAIPRTASTSFEMAVVPFLGHELLNYKFVIQILYSIVFFGIALFIAFHPEKLTDRLGKILCPLLLGLILIIFVRSLFVGHYAYSEGVSHYQDQALIKGFLDGYLTMDTIAALNFGIIISLNIRNMGIKDNKVVVRSTVKAGIIAGACLTLVYCMLLHIGGLSGYYTGYHENGTQTLISIVSFLFQNTGVIILGTIFFIACLNTCIGLICCCSEYFSEIIPSISYRKWALIFAGVSMIISNIGLNLILEISVPILSMLYPISIVLIFLAFCHKYISRFTYIYPITIFFTFIGAILDVLPSLGIHIHVLELIPFYNLSLGWISFAFIGIIVSLFIKNK